MTKLRPYLPYAADETPISWATRLAALHTGGDLISFLHDIGIPYGDMLVNRESAIGRLCDLTGEDSDKVRQDTIWLLSRASYTLRGIPFTADFLHGKNTMFCPACLGEDDLRGDHPAAQRRGQTIWLLRPVRTCPEHQLPLMEREAKLWSDGLREMTLRVPERGHALAKLATDLTPRTPSPLQDYVLARLDGKAGPDWLDGQQIEQAFRATEMLGVVLEFGAKPNLNLMTGNDWDRAGRTGFEFTRRNKQGIQEALTFMQDRFVEDAVSQTSLAGPQMVFGRLYQWLEFAKAQKDRGPIRGLLREHILDTMEMAPGKRLLGEEVSFRRRHSVQSLAKATSTHPATVRNYLVANCLIPADPLKAVIASVDAAEGERLAEMMKTSVAQIHLPKALNTTRGQVVQLVKSGLLPPILRVKDVPGRHLPSVALDVVRRFLADINRCAEVVEKAPNGTFGIPDAAQISRATTAVIVQMMLDGRLSRVFQVAGVPGYGGIRVDPDEVRKMGKPEVTPVAVPIEAIRVRLGVSYGVVKALMASRDGGPWLPTVPASTRSGFLVLMEGADAFAKNHVSLMALSKESGVPPVRLRRALDVAGVTPIDDPAKLKARIYRRADIPPQFSA